MATDHEQWDEDLVKAVDLLAESFAAKSIRHALIGGLATSMRGRQRTTQDADFLIEVPQIQLPGLLDDLVERGFTLDPPLVIRQYVQRNITSFLFRPVRIDWLKPVLPIYARTLADAQPLQWGKGQFLRVATAEGLILTKMIAFRQQDQMDIETLLTANRETINLDLIREYWSEFAAKEPERTAWLEAVIEKRVLRHE